MKILIVIERGETQRFLVCLHTEGLVRDVTKLIARERRSQAIVEALSRGRFEREVETSELPHLDAELILSEHHACWDCR